MNFTLLFINVYLSSCQINAPIFKFENQILEVNKMSDIRFPLSIITENSN